MATVFAAHAAVAWSTSQTIENLKAGMVTRQLIGQAVGLLMVRQDMSETDALDALATAPHNGSTSSCDSSRSRSCIPLGRVRLPHPGSGDRPETASVRGVPQASDFVDFWDF